MVPRPCPQPKYLKCSIRNIRNEIITYFHEGRSSFGLPTKQLLAEVLLEKLRVELISVRRSPRWIHKVNAYLERYTNVASALNLAVSKMRASLIARRR